MSSVSRSVGRPVTRSVLAGQLNNLTQLIKSLFGLGEQGFAYDPNDLSTLYQDAAGTIPVTAAGQSVGLILDKSKGFGFGGELATNGDFSKGLTGWAAGTNASMTLSSGELILTTPGSQVVTVNNAVYQTVIGHYAGRRYNIEFDATYISGGDLSVGVGNQPAIIVSSAQNAGQKKRYTCSLSDTAVSPTRVITFASKDVLSTWRIDNVSCKQVLGNHAYQTVSASRPILQRNATTGAYYLAFDGADDFLQTNNIDFTATDKVTVIYAAKRVLESATGTVIELSPAAYSNNKSFGVFSPATNGGKNTGATLRTDTSYYLVNTKQDNTFVSTFKTEIGSGNSSVTTNKQAFNQSTTPFAGTFGNYPVYIGRREGKFLPFGGQIYALLVIGKLLDDATTQRIEKEFVKYIGVTLNV